MVGLWSEWIDIEDVDPLPTFLSKAVCPNPEHDTFKRHFQVNTKQATVHCFGDCGISGTYEHALCVILGIYDERKITRVEINHAKTRRGINEPAEVVAARERVGAAWKQARRHILQHTILNFGKTDFTSYSKGTRKTVTADDAVAKDEAALRGGRYQFLPKHVREYLDSRGIETSARGKWELGWDEEAGRLVIPVYDDRGTFRFLVRRQLDNKGSLKYLYTDGSIRTSVLYGACYLDMETIRSTGGMILTEGTLDVIRLHQKGFTNAVAILGSGISTRQVRLLDKFDPGRLYLMFDADSAGVDYVLDVSTKIKKIPLYVCRYPKDKSDPAEMTGGEVTKSLQKALPIHEFLRLARDVTRKLAHA